MNVIEVQDLYRYYGSTKAVNGITFGVRKGEAFGFLGPNGAGKTTTLKVLTTLLQPTKGNAFVLGFDVRNEGSRIRERIGLVQQQPSYEPDMRVRSQLDLYGYLWRVSKKERRLRTAHLMQEFGLSEYADKKPGDLSIGLRRRLQIVRELIHETEILFLDEPTIGLDPIAKRRTLEFLKTMMKAGLSIFLSTNNMSEAEFLCSRVGLIDRGKIVAIGEPQQLVRDFKAVRILDVRLEGDARALLSELRREFPNIANTEIEGPKESQQLRIQVEEPETLLPSVIKACVANGWRLTGLTLNEPSLEDLFVKIMSQKGLIA